MKKRVFKFSKKYLKNNFYLGLFQIGIGIFSLIFDSINLFFQLGWLTVGILQLIKYYVEKPKIYLTIKEDVIVINNLFNKKSILISKYTEVIRYKNYIMLKNNNNKEKIQTWIAENGTHDFLFQELKKMISHN